jgi:hypothetical protein
VGARNAHFDIVFDVFRSAQNHARRGNNHRRIIPRIVAGFMIVSPNTPETINTGMNVTGNCAPPN